MSPDASGSAVHRHDVGEAVENLTGGEYYGMGGNFIKYGASDIEGKAMTAADLPMDSHELVALCAPRPCLISYGIPNPHIPGGIGDPAWVDAHGSYMAGVLASPVYDLFGEKGFGHPALFFSDPAKFYADPMPPLSTLVGRQAGLAAARTRACCQSDFSHVFHLDSTLRHSTLSRPWHRLHPHRPFKTDRNVTGDFCLLILTIHFFTREQFMNRKFFAWTLSSVTAFTCAALISTAMGGAAPGGGGGRGAGGRGGRGGPAVPPGPPATVPAEVAMAGRPTPDELTQLNADVKRLVETDTSPDKELLKKYEGLISVVPPRNTAIMPAPGVRAQRHQGFVDTAKTGDFDILFEGDSITDFWQSAPAQQGGAEVFKKYFGDVKVANFAVSGDSTQGNIWGLKNGEGQGHKPKAVMLMIGTNNTATNTAPEIAEGVGAVVVELRNDFPDAKIMLLAIFPRGAGPTDANRVKNDEVNKLIAKLDDQKHVFFTNINGKFLDAKGALIGFRTDNLHPTPEGYEIWGAAVADTLKGMAK